MLPSLIERAGTDVNSGQQRYTFDLPFLMDGVGLDVVHGSVTTLQDHSFGKMTVRLTGNQEVIEDFYSTLRQTTAINEITSGSAAAGSTALGAATNGEAQ